MIVVVSRFAKCAIASVAGCCEAAGHDRLGRQDKRPHIAASTVGCFAYAFWSFLHIAGHEREARLLELSSDFSVDRTSRTPTP